MAFTRVQIDTQRITDWDSFHDVFAEAFGFPHFYGRNMNAWIDCLTCIDDPEAGMSRLHAPAGGVIALELLDVGNFAKRCPELYEAIIECSASVNYRRGNHDHQPDLGPVIALSFYK